MNAPTERSDTDKQQFAQTFQQALSYLERGNLPIAESLLRPLLHLIPEEPNGWQLLGVVRAQQGDLAEATTLLQRSVELAPDNAGAHHNLGNVLGMQLRREDAVQALNRSLELDPANPSALITRAHMYQQLQRPLDALSSLDAALVLEPGSRQALIARADTMRPLADMGFVTREVAVAAYHAALEAGADPDNVHYCLAAMGEGTPPASAPPKFVTDLFDTYADSFDEHLLEALQYRTPMQIGQALQHVAQGGDAQVLDLGCGTGLCAPLLRPLARHLKGLDLSPRMLDKARERGLYDELVCADLLAYLVGLPAANLDLVVAADVFVYVGDLNEVFAATARALRAGGRFVFSIETLAEPAAGYALRATRRYAHARSHVQTQATAHGLHQEYLQEGVLRMDAGSEVAGAVLVLRRS